MTDEQVLVIARERVPDAAGWYGLRTDGMTAFLASVGDHARFAPREAMEADPAWKQLIPYLVLRDGERYFLMRRTRAGGDARLHDRWSIGVGGHLNPGDADLTGGLQREWREELDADFVPDFQPIALLNDDTSDVGAVHLGIVVVADAAGRAVRVRETEKLSGSFATAAEVAAVADRLETWSQLVFAALEAPPRPIVASREMASAARTVDRRR
jgi:predicted NUDIX family phosphoesterase